MFILDERCTGCGRCITECHVSAIRQTADGRYAIDEAACDECAVLYERQCIRVCPATAIVRRVRGDGFEEAPFDPTPRLRAHNLIYFVAALMPKGFWRFEEPGWQRLREFIAQAYMNPEMIIRFSTHNDDLCIGCQKRTDAQHLAQNKAIDDVVMTHLGVLPGQAMNIWDAVRLAENRLSLPLLKQIGLSDDYLGIYRTDPRFARP